MDEYDTARLRQLSKRYRKLVDDLDAVRPDLQAEVLAALAAGTRQAEVARITGWTRDNIRQLVRRREGSGSADGAQAL